MNRKLPVAILLVMLLNLAVPFDSQSVTLTESEATVTPTDWVAQEVFANASAWNMFATGAW